MANDKFKVLIVDDSALVRKIVSEALTAEGDIEIVGLAANGKIALEKLEFLRPDVVLLDLEMPEMDGFQALKAIRSRYKELPVVVFSTLTERGAKATLDALSGGASDYLCKPSGTGGIHGSVGLIRTQLAPKLRGLCARRVNRTSLPEPISARSLPPPAVSSSPVEFLAIGTSAGGPQALATLIPALPKNFEVPVMVVQHMPAVFTRVLAERLSATSHLKVVEASTGMQVERGMVYLAPGDFHMQVTSRSGRTFIALNQGPLENGCRPAVDPLFRSAAEIYGPTLLALVLTGMGSDGTAGAKAVRRNGGRVWAQDESTSTIWGMAGSVVRAGLAERVAKLEMLAHDLTRVTSKTPSQVVLPPRSPSVVIAPARQSQIAAPPRSPSDLSPASKTRSRA